MMSRAVLPVSVVVLALAGLAGCNDKPSPANPAQLAAAADPVASRVLVLSGDTLVIDGRHVQLANIVAPQPIPDARCWAEAIAAKHAVQFVKAQLQAARTITVKPTGVIDNYNRTVATVALDGLDLGRTLYEEGAAAQPKGDSFRWCEPLSTQLDGPPTSGSLSEPGR